MESKYKSSTSDENLASEQDPDDIIQQKEC